MWYQFDDEGECVSSSTGEVEIEENIISVYCGTTYSDIENVRLVNGNVVHIGQENEN